jgi:hypothetical protein
MKLYMFRREELSKTCRVSFPKCIWEIIASSWFYYKETPVNKLNKPNEA